METSERTIDTTTDDGDMAVVITEPAGAPPEGGWPTVLWYMDLPGIRTHLREGMARLAGEGYRVVAPDLHHRLGRLLHKEPKDMGQPGAKEEMFGWLGVMTDDQIQHDGERALDAAGLGSDDTFLIIGFCLGARAAYRTVERHPGRVLAASSFHPSNIADDEPDSPHLTAGDCTIPMYFGIGEADQMQSIAKHQRFIDAVAPHSYVEIETFPGADHGYTWPGTPNYNENAAETSWAKTFALFSKALA